MKWVKMELKDNHKTKIIESSHIKTFSFTPGNKTKGFGMINNTTYRNWSQKTTLLVKKDDKNGTMYFTINI